jgi:hypothetical protein
MRNATIHTAHADAPTVAAAVIPDNTPEMATRVDGETVVTTIERETTGGLQSSVDDYVVNVGVADAVAGLARAFEGDDATRQAGRSDGTGARTNSETTDTNPRTNTNTQ